VGFRNLSAELNELRGLSQERREGLRQLLEVEVFELAPNDELSRKWHTQILEDLDSLDPCASLLFLRRIVHYLRSQVEEYFPDDITQEAHKKAQRGQSYL